MPDNPILDTIQEGSTTYDIVGKKVHNTNTATGAVANISIWFGTQAEYDALPIKDPATLYKISNESPTQTVYDSTLNIKVNNTSVGTFTANASVDKDINITVPTKASDISAVAANTAITGATKCKITYDSKGLVTSGANLQASDIPDLTLNKITDVTATATELNVLDGITASTTELNYVDGVTSAIQTQLNGKVTANNAITAGTGTKITYDAKGLVTSSTTLSASDIPDISSTYQTKITGGATTITGSNLTVSRALISNSSGKVAVSAVTSTELGYLDGVTSAIQSQIDGKQAKIGAGTANNIVAYSGTAGTLNTLTRTTSVRAKASASDTYIPTEKAVATSLEGKYDASNPNGYTSNVGTVTSVNNVSPVNGDVTLSIPSEVTETTVSNWGFTKNTGTVTSVNNVSPVSGNVTLSIPTVNNSTISFTQGGVSKGSFTLNQSTAATIALDAGGSGVDIPSQTGQSGKFLTTDGTDLSWGTVYALQINDYTGD